MKNRERMSFFSICDTALRKATEKRGLCRKSLSHMECGEPRASRPFAYGLSSRKMRVCALQELRRTMHFSKILLRGCLSAGQWLFVLTAVLALASLAADWLRDDQTGRPGVLIAVVLGSLALAAVFFAVGRALNSDGANR
jgi:hypothetical protein